MRRDKPDTEAQDRELVRAYLADELAPEVRRVRRHARGHGGAALRSWRG
jgi:hypothetical protein